ncbi:MAG: spore coat associated protein CotJA [Bacillota bacterium]|nr:spore coat associated protein CotJA [Bacillota bacterium]
MYNNYFTANSICPIPAEMQKLAQAFVPFQCMYCIYSPLVGLQRGTIFPELDRPYGVDPEYMVDA